MTNREKNPVDISNKIKFVPENYNYEISLAFYIQFPTLQSIDGKRYFHFIVSGAPAVSRDTGQSKHYFSNKYRMSRSQIL